MSSVASNRRRAKRYYWRHKEKVLSSQAKAYADNPEPARTKSRERAAKNRTADRERQHESRLRVLFCLTPEEYTLINAYQEAHPTHRVLLGNGKMRNAVEHRHSDGLIRGVMSPMLNRAYGFIERLFPNNTAEILRALAEFHDNPPATTALGTPRFGLIGKAMYKKVMIYGSPTGPLPPIKRGKK